MLKEHEPLSSDSKCARKLFILIKMLQQKCGENEHTRNLLVLRSVVDES